MLLKLTTFKTSDTSTIGTLSIDGQGECFTLEDTYREKKIDGETRIPRGKYQIKFRTDGGMHIRYSRKFKELHQGMLWLQDVPGFEWIYIHYGNYARNTEGCILVGSSADLNKDMVGNSIETYKKLYRKVAAALSTGEDVFIEIV